MNKLHMFDEVITSWDDKIQMWYLGRGFRVPEHQDVHAFLFKLNGSNWLVYYAFESELPEFVFVRKPTTCDCLYYILSHMMTAKIYNRGSTGPLAYIRFRDIMTEVL